MKHMQIIVSHVHKMYAFRAWYCAQLTQTLTSVHENYHVVGHQLKELLSFYRPQDKEINYIAIFSSQFFLAHLLAANEKQPIIYFMQIGNFLASVVWIVSVSYTHLTLPTKA